MTTFFADIRVYRLPDHHYATCSVELGAPDIATAVLLLQAWQAGLRANPQFDAGMEESIYSTKRRSATYHTLREASSFLLMHLFDRAERN